MRTESKGSSQLIELETLLAKKMKQALTGDAEAYQELLREVRDTLLRYFSRHLNRARIEDRTFGDDLIQEALIAIHEKRMTYDTTQPFTAWMYAIARYKMIDLIRRRKNLNLRDDIETMDNIASVLPEQPGVTKLDLESLLQVLPERQRQVVELTKLQGLSIEEVANRTGMSISSVKVTVHRAIKTMKQKIERDGI